MYKRLILRLAAIALVIIGSSLAQEMEGSGQLDSGEIIIVPESDIWTGLSDETGEVGQTMTGVDTGDLISSGLEFTGTENPSLSGDVPPVFGSGEITGEIISGTISNSRFRLLISEVYYDGTDERIEITNIGNETFSGKIILSGVKSSLVNITNILIPSGVSMIFGDILDQVTGNIQIGKTGLSLNLIDTATINIHIIVSGQIEDSFFVDQYRVNKYNDKKTSFEKVGMTITPVITERVRNANPKHLINPGRYFTTGIELIDVSFSPGTLFLPISCDSLSQSGLVKVSEIFRGNEKYPSYIELSIHDNITINHLSLSGNLMSSNVAFFGENQDMYLEKNTFFLISATGFRQNNDGLPGGQNSDFSLVSTGNRLLITIGSGQNRQVMDIVYISGYTPGKSSYFNNSTYQCARIMDAVDDFSPGFERVFLKYMPVRTIKEIQYIEKNTESSLCQTGVNIPSSASGSLLSPLSSSFVPEHYTIKILHVDYNPSGGDTNKEKITLLATHISGDMTPLDMSKIFKLKVNGKNKLLSGFLPMDIPTTFTKTFNFPNSTKSGQDVIVTLNYNDYVFDTYIYNPNTLSKKEKEELTTTGYYVSSVIDGDSFRIKYQGKTQTVRMLGIDAPESSLTRFRHLECFGTESKIYLKNLIDKKRITFKFDDSQNQRDLYGRLLAYVYLDDTFINLAMLRDGYAKQYTFKTPYHYQSQFKQAELAAQQEKIGLRNEKICGHSRSGVQRSGDLEEKPTDASYLSGLDFTITYVLPNPKGKNASEELGLLIDFKGKMEGESGGGPIINGELNIENGKNKQEAKNEGGEMEVNEQTIQKTLNMDQGFFLRVGDKKKEIGGNPTIGKEYIFSGNLGLVNKATCVSLIYEEIELAKFCYPKPKKGQKIYSSFVDFEEVTKEVFDVFNEIKIKKINNTLCAIYKDSPITCKRIPVSKAEKRTIRERAMYKSFSSLIRKYLLNNWKQIYYNTEIKRYFDLLATSKKLIAKGYAKIDIYGQKIDVDNIKKQWETIKKTPIVIVAAYEGKYALQTK